MWSQDSQVAAKRLPTTEYLQIKRRLIWRWHHQHHSHRGPLMPSPRRTIAWRSLGLRTSGTIFLRPCLRYGVPVYILGFMQSLTVESHIYYSPYRQNFKSTIHRIDRTSSELGRIRPLKVLDVHEPINCDKLCYMGTVLITSRNSLGVTKINAAFSARNEQAVT